MSCRTDLPHHFCDWIEEKDLPYQKTDFLPRRLYGEYLGEQIEKAKNVFSLDSFQEEITSLEGFEGPWCSLHSDKGREAQARSVVLLLGNFPPKDILSHPLPSGGELPDALYARSPWRVPPETLRGKERILLIGSGLTAVDYLGELDRMAFSGRIDFISRHGHLPQAHAQPQSPPEEFLRMLAEFGTETELRVQLRSFQRIRKAWPHFWREAVDGLRPKTQAFWQGWKQNEQAQFLRHLRSFWDTHRHRMAETLAVSLERLLENGQMCLRAGRILAARNIEEREVEVDFRPRGATMIERMSYDYVINCTGPESRIRKAPSALLQDLFEKKRILPDPLELGLSCDPDGRLLDAHGRPYEQLLTFGPLRKGALWETTAVPELRVQASDLVSKVLIPQLRKTA
jgi:uncharacterized NAD(P)/FAD-binding protein YdhS